MRLASKLVGWDIEIMTIDEMNESIERAEGWFRQIPGVTDELVELLITEGFMSYVDVTFIEPTDLAELGGVTVEQAEEMIAFAEAAAERLENAPPEEAKPDEEAMAGRTVVGEPVEATTEAAPTEGGETPAEVPGEQTEGEPVAVANGEASAEPQNGEMATTPTEEQAPQA